MPREIKPIADIICKVSSSPIQNTVINPSKSGEIPLAIG